MSEERLARAWNEQRNVAMISVPMVFAVLWWMSLLSWDTAFGASVPEEKQTLLLILIDGARWDITSSGLTPNLKRLAEEGVQAEMIPVWPTSSSPNHWALATGLYPVRGGVYDNDMFDPTTGGWFDRSQDSWAHGEPIWAAVARQGNISGVIGGWAGAQIAKGARRPSFYIPYTPPTDDCQHCLELSSVVLPLLDQLPDTRPQFLALYFLEPDHSQHRYGVGSPEAGKVIGQLDAMIGNLISALAKAGLANKVNIIVVSDHGQVNRHAHREILYIDDEINTDDLVTGSIPVRSPGPIMEVWPKPGKEEAIYERLRKHANSHIHVFRAADIPARWHCCDPTRAPPIIVTTDSEAVVGFRSSHGSGPIGVHGYDNAVRDMHSLFIAAGPAFKKTTQLPPFNNIDLYALMAAILNVEPSETDGSIVSLCSILVHPPASCMTKP